MTLSVNTNIGAMVALQHLNSTNTAMEKTQLAITTGLRVNGPKDDASTYAIAQNMRGDIVGLGAVKTALANGEANRIPDICPGYGSYDEGGTTRSCGSRARGALEPPLMANVTGRLRF